jgi:hypothetical protein
MRGYTIAPLRTLQLGMEPTKLHNLDRKVHPQKGAGTLFPRPKLPDLNLVRWHHTEFTVV